MDQLVLTRAVYRRRYGTELPEASVPSRFLEEVPGPLHRRVGKRSSPWDAHVAEPSPHEVATSIHLTTHTKMKIRAHPGTRATRRSDRLLPRNRQWQLVPTIRSRTLPSFSPAAERSFRFQRCAVEEPTGKRGFRPGQKVRHPKYGEGTVYQREGEGEEAKITVQFPRFGLKKLVEKYAQLERA